MVFRIQNASRRITYCRGGSFSYPIVQRSRKIIRASVIVILALEDRYRHAWLRRLSLGEVELGSGKRALVPGGRLHSIYQSTLPRGTPSWFT
ncbi:type IV toxin-antitoxin system AbiEi family antitoxin domain-containing protein [Vreelandella titanicae]|jgi:Transcriptional regulator, AbiEi antitoxin, Type IV TA system|uniref:type IV toxin-antitoxin system AbiEi family antitoxin domain-containing protein n=1 Tax=Vreelandella titanicae TaxID=664683 RepID=UPI0039BFA3B5